MISPRCSKRSPHRHGSPAGAPGAAGNVYKWTTLLAALSTVAVAGAWHASTPPSAPTSSAGDECALAAPRGSFHRLSLHSDDSAREEEDLAPDEGETIGDSGDDRIDDERREDDPEPANRYAYDDGDDDGDEGSWGRRRVFSFDGELDEEDDVITASASSPATQQHEGPTTAAAAPSALCLANPRCLAASLTDGGPVPDTFAGEGFLFQRARDDLARHEFQSAAKNFVLAAARIPTLYATSDGPIARDLEWICRGAALAMEAGGMKAGPTELASLDGSSPCARQLRVAPPSKPEDPIGTNPGVGTDPPSGPPTHG